MMCEECGGPIRDRVCAKCGLVSNEPYFDPNPVVIIVSPGEEIFRNGSFGHPSNILFQESGRTFPKWSPYESQSFSRLRQIDHKRKDPSRYRVAKTLLDWNSYLDLSNYRLEQILYELDSLLEIFQKDEIQESHISRGVARLERIIEIQKILICPAYPNTQLLYKIIPDA